MKRTLLTLVCLIATFSSVVADDKSDATEVVNSFYSNYIAAAVKGQDGDKVVKKAPQLSPAFKKAYADLVAKAKKADPEIGLGYDPIINGQDFPDAGYAVSSITLKGDTGTAVVFSKDKNFKNTIPLTLIKIDGKWFINGIDKLKAG